MPPLLRLRISATFWPENLCAIFLSFYPSIDRRKVFASGEVIDETLDIRLPISEIFA